MTDRFRFTASRPVHTPPAGACDCHIHVFGPINRYPLVARRSYTPMDALPDDAKSMMRSLGMERVVFVQPSPYGADNRCMLDAMRAFGGVAGGVARGVAVIDDDAPDADLQTLDAAGVRGIRLNIASGGNHSDLPLGERVERLAGRIAGLGWHLQLFVAPDALVAIEASLVRLPVPFVIDHMGLIPSTLVPYHGAHATLLRLLESERCWVKLSGAYRVGGSDAAFESVAPLARTLVDKCPDRLVWGSDWPHTPHHEGAPDRSGARRPYRTIDTGRLLDLLSDWAPDPDTRARILVRNPARLYGFDEPS